MKAVVINTLRVEKNNIDDDSYNVVDMQGYAVEDPETGKISWATKEEAMMALQNITAQQEGREMFTLEITYVYCDFDCVNSWWAILSDGTRIHGCHKHEAVSDALNYIEEMQDMLG